MANITIVAKNEIELYKPVSVVHMIGNPTLQQRKAWNWMVKHASPNLLKEKYHQIPVKQLKKWLGHADENKNYDDVYESLLSLMTTIVEWNVMQKDNDERWKIKSKEAMTMLSYIHIENGVCTYAFFPLLAEKLSERLMYIKINLQLQNRFNSVYGLILYEFLKTYYIEKNKKGLTPKLKLNQFREVMGVKSTEYKRFNDFNLYVIKPAIKEINAKTDVFTEVTLIKESRKVVALQFEIAENKDKEKNMKELNQMIDCSDELDLMNETTQEVEPNNILKTKLEKLGFGENQIEKLLADPEPQKVLDCADYVTFKLQQEIETNKTKNKIQNPTGYFFTIYNAYEDIDFSGLKDWRAKQSKVEQEKIEWERKQKEEEEEEQRQAKLSKLKQEKLAKYKQDHPMEVEMICMDVLGRLQSENKTFILEQVKNKAKKEEVSLIKTVASHLLTKHEVDSKIWERVEK